MRLLVIRVSAMGDVALTVPVLKGLEVSYPDLSITMVTSSVFAPFFVSCSNVSLFHPDFKGRHKGLAGIFALYGELKALGEFDGVVDLHGVIRSVVLSSLFRFSGVKVSSIKKGRRARRRLVRGRDGRQLKSSVEKYCDAFSSVGFPVQAATTLPVIIPAETLPEGVRSRFSGESLNVGVAPYARHDLKMWPQEYMEVLLNKIASRRTTRFWLMGGKEDLERLEALEQRVAGSSTVAGMFTLGEELTLMSNLDFMITMDSSNMHMAALVGTKVISIWCATDPLAGFGAWQQTDDRAVRVPVEELPCRPCTIYGKGVCKRGDNACMRWLTPEMVFERLISLGLL